MEASREGPRFEMIKDNVAALVKEIPPGVELVAAAKTRTPSEIEEALEAGIRIIGENYVQEAQRAFQSIGARARWHMIGHLQTNKVKKAVELFDMIETVDSLGLGREIDKRCASIGKTMEALVEVNSGREPQKAGVMPEKVENLIRDLSVLPNLRIRGLMTMGPFEGNPEHARPYFIETKKIWNALKALSLEGVEMRYLSMGMTNSFRVAIEEGANMIRIGTAIFGPR
jgi:pyridoxal phosphate enzyme (YggS family)